MIETPYNTGFFGYQVENIERNFFPLCPPHFFSITPHNFPDI